MSSVSKNRLRSSCGQEQDVEQSDTKTFMRNLEAPPVLQGAETGKPQKGLAIDPDDRQVDEAASVRLLGTELWS